MVVVPQVLRGERGESPSSAACGGGRRGSGATGVARGTRRVSFFFFCYKEERRKTSYAAVSSVGGTGVGAEGSFTSAPTATGYLHQLVSFIMVKELK